MPQLLESTRNYLKSSTKIGRRMSSYRDDSRSTSEASLHDMKNSTAPSSLESLKQPLQHRPTTQNRLSSLFSLEGRNRNSISSEDRAAATATPTTATGATTAVAVAAAAPAPAPAPTGTTLSRKIVPETTTAQGQQLHNDIAQKKRKSTHSTKSSQQQQQEQQQRHQRQSSPDLYSDAGDVPRGRSPTLSVSQTDYSVGSGTSSYDARPSDYPSLKHYQAHVWRRNLLEESIMHSLKLGYGEARPRRHRSRSLKGSSSTGNGRSRKMSREQQSAMVAAVMSKDLPPCPNGEGAPVTVILTRDGGNKSAKPNTNNKSPYQMLLNPSTTNITQSVASFTLELDEHRASRVMSSSAVPGLFTIKIGPSSRQQRGRTNSTARMMTGGLAPSTRVLTGKTHLIDQENVDSLLMV